MMVISSGLIYIKLFEYFSTFLFSKFKNGICVIAHDFGQDYYVNNQGFVPNNGLNKDDNIHKSEAVKR